MIASSDAGDEQRSNCPRCGGLVSVDSSIFLGEAVCPSCGQAIWFLQFADLLKLFDTDQTAELKERVVQYWEGKLKASRDRIVNCSKVFQATGIDSLPVVEFVMEFEEGFGDDFTIGEDDVAR